MGLWLALTLIKFGNPVILEGKIEAPTNWAELVVSTWPPDWGYWLLGGVVLGGIGFWRWRTMAPKWLVVLPLVWFIWEVFAGIQTVNPTLTKPVLTHFASCAVVFYLGLFALSSVNRLRLLWIGLLGGFLVVLIVGWNQHFGGLEETRRYFYELPNWQEFPPEFIKKLSSNRIYATLFYPNTLAGVIILLLPIFLTAVWQVPETRWGKGIAAGALAVGSLACLYWSGSKAGWLIMLGLAVVALLHWPLPRRLKLGIASVVVVAGLAGFMAVYAGYFSRGATSVSARLDYWKAGWRLMLEKPALGWGPGTFQVGYARLKAPESEMARLAHNDYLEQGADAGVPGFLLYAVFIAGAMTWLHRGCQNDPLRLAVWLGLLGLATQGLVEFGLYIPAIAWPQFLLTGWLIGSARPKTPHSP